MRLLDYECKTTFWNDFSIAELFGEEAVRDTYKRDWKIGSTEQNSGWYLTISVGIGMRKNDTFSKLYAELWEEYHDWVLDNWKGEDLKYYLEIKD